MGELFRKEMRLSASVLSYLFIIFGLMFFIPGYPILCGAFFVTLGIFQSFQYAREANDVVFSALLPVAKRDTVKAKYLFACFIEGCAFAVMCAAVVLRMTVLSDALPYRNNALMNANPFALGAALVIFGLFNAIFIGGFYKTAYKFAKPFVLYAAAAFLTVGAAEALHHFPHLGALNSFGFGDIGLQLSLLGAGMLIYALMTLISCRIACGRLERIDL